MSGRATIDTSRFNAMVRELGRKASVPPERALLYEVGKVIEGAMNFTPSAQVGRLRSRHDAALFSSQPASLYSPRRGRSKATLTKNGFITYYLQNRYPNALWNKIQAARKARLAAAIRARGLAKQSWLEIAKALGVTINVPGYVQSAIASTGQKYSNVSVRLSRSNGRLQITIENSQPTVNLPQVGGARALQRAIDGRTRFFVQNLGREVFNDMAQIAKKYPGMKVTA
jgi:hypothetical protein